MTELKNKLREDTKKYLQQIYNSHRDEDLLAWDQLTDIFFLYIDISIQEHVNKLHN